MIDAIAHNVTASSLCSPHSINHWDTDFRWYFENLDEEYIAQHVWAIDQASMSRDVVDVFNALSWSSEGKAVVQALKTLHSHSSYEKDVTNLTSWQRTVLTDELSEEIAFYNLLKNVTRAKLQG